MMTLNPIIRFILVQKESELKYHYYFLKGAILMMKIEDYVLLYFFISARWCPCRGSCRFVYNTALFQKNKEKIIFLSLF